MKTLQEVDELKTVVFRPIKNCYKHTHTRKGMKLVMAYLNLPFIVDVFQLLSPV